MLDDFTSLPFVPSGRAQLEVAKRWRVWSDGSAVGRGFGQPYLHEFKYAYAAAIALGEKTVEGRPGGGFVKPAKGRAMQPGDWINFKISDTNNQIAVRPYAKGRLGVSRECSAPPPFGGDLRASTPNPPRASRHGPTLTVAA